jgi:hypothetical protein
LIPCAVTIRRSGLADACPDREPLAGVARRDAVVVGLERDQRAACRDALDDDLGWEREHGKCPQRLAGAELADGAPTPATLIGHR